MLQGIVVSHKDLPQETLPVPFLKRQHENVIVVNFYYFGPLTLRHSFEYSPKMLKDEVLLIEGKYCYCHCPWQTPQNITALLDFSEESDK